MADLLEHDDTVERGGEGHRREHGACVCIASKAASMPPISLIRAATSPDFTLARINPSTMTAYLPARLRNVRQEMKAAQALLSRIRQLCQRRGDIQNERMAQRSSSHRP